AVPLTVERGELVQKTGPRADPLVLHPRAEPRQLPAVDGLGVREREQGEAERDLERSRRGKAGAPGHRPGDLDAGATERQSGAPELADRTAHERAPAGRRLGTVELESIL